MVVLLTLRRLYPRFSKVFRERSTAAVSYEVQSSNKSGSDLKLSDSQDSKYEQYKAQVARIMGANPETFTEKDLKESLEYLFPTALFDRKARPMLMATDPLATTSKKAEVMDEYNRPIDPGFFTGFPKFHEVKYKIFKIWEANLAKPMTLESRYKLDNDTEVFRKPTIVKKTVMEDLLSEQLSDEQYEEIVGRLCGVATLNDNEDVKELLSIYAVPVISAMKQLSIKKDENPQCYGYRKAAYARVSLVQGSGIVTVNQRNMLDYFPRLQDRLQVLYPLQVHSMLGQYDVVATVKGGGMTGQAGAIRLGLSRCIASLPHINMNQLFASGLLTTDRRKVERKKPGQKKARKKFTWVKR